MKHTLRLFGCKVWWSGGNCMPGIRKRFCCEETCATHVPTRGSACAAHLVCSKRIESWRIFSSRVIAAVSAIFQSGFHPRSVSMSLLWRLVSRGCDRYLRPASIMRAHLACRALGTSSVSAHAMAAQKTATSRVWQLQLRPLIRQLRWCACHGYLDDVPRRMA